MVLLSLLSLIWRQFYYYLLHLFLGSRRGSRGSSNASATSSRSNRSGTNNVTGKNNLGRTGTSSALPAHSATNASIAPNTNCTAHQMPVIEDVTVQITEANTPNSTIEQMNMDGI